MAVDPAYTSQTCPGCGVIVEKGVSVRWHACPECVGRLWELAGVLGSIGWGKPRTRRAASPCGVSIVWTRIKSWNG